MTVIHTTRFDAQRNRRARDLREYGDGLDELNGYPPLPVTREAPVADARYVPLGLIAGMAFAAAVACFKFRVWEVLERGI